MSNTSCLPGRGIKLCQVCGPNINTDNVEFSRREANLVYLDKVYSYNEASTCPILQTLTTTADTYTSELVFKNTPTNDGCGCGCGNGGNCGCGGNSGGSFHCQNCFFGCGCNCGNGGDTCTLDANAVFNITRSYVLVESFGLSNPAGLRAADVTADGVAVDTLTQTGNQYSATTAALIPQIVKKRCTELGLPTKAFFLIASAGPWSFQATFVLEGTVNTGGKTCCFQAKFRNVDGTPGTITGASNFALPKVSFPCIVGGVAPEVNFRFSGRISMLSPEITVTCTGGTCTLALTTRLAVEPKVNLEVVRRTLFCLDACEGMLPCDGTEAAYELADDEEDCEWPPKPACRCGSAPTPPNDEEICDCSPVCNFEEEDCCCQNGGGGTGSGANGSACGSCGSGTYNPYPTGCSSCRGW